MTLISKKFFFLLIIISKLCTFISHIYKIPFGLFDTKGKDVNIDMIESIYFNLIYTNLSIGTPPQNVPFGLSMNTQTFTINNKVFNEKLSSTYEELSIFNATYDNENEDISLGFKSIDILNIDNQKQKISFILSTKLKYENYPFGIIGLVIPKNIEPGIYPFFNSLKLGNIIDSFTWTLKYFNNMSLIDTLYGNKINNKPIGEFIFGDDPHYYEENKSKYNKSQLIRINPLSSYDLNWDIQFSNIYFMYHENKNNNQTSQKKNINLNGRTKLIPDAGFIFVPKEFNYIIKKNFFEKYFNESICRTNGINNTFYGYTECDANDKFEISSFPDVCFEHKEFETTFNLTYKDLFIYDKNKNKYLFLMLTDKYLSGWIFGSIFLRKYQFIFNQDSKTIGYYKSMNNFYDETTKNENIEKKDGIVKYIIIVILFLISSLLLIFFGMLIQKKCFNKNKKSKAHELEDENLLYEDSNKNNSNYQNINN